MKQYSIIIIELYNFKILLLKKKYIYISPVSMCILYFCWLDSNQYFLIIIIIEEREREKTIKSIICVVPLI